MISFIIKHTPVVLDLFTKDSLVYETAKMRKAINFLPDWWKNLPKEIPDLGGYPSATMRSCAGFVDLYQQGFVMPMWSDVYVNVSPSVGYKWQFADQKSAASTHPREQAGQLLISNNAANLKLHSPWGVVCKTKLLWHLSQPFWNTGFQKNYVVPPAVVDFNAQSESNINLVLLGMDEEKSFVIPFGEPMVHYVPLTDRKVKLAHHLVSSDEYTRILSKSGPVAFVGSYRKKMKVKERGDE